MERKKQTSFATRLQELRLASRMTQSELAKAINVSRSCIANYERGKRFPDTDILTIISNYFKVSVDYLLSTDNSLFFENDYNRDIATLLKEVSTTGKLDISNISPLSKIALFEFYNFLGAQERIAKGVK